MAQGNAGTEGVRNGKTNNTTLTQSKARYECGVELYKSGAVGIGKDGLFRVNGYTVDVQKVKCERPDYQAHRQPCKHFYASSLFSRYGKPRPVLSRSEEPVLSVAKEKEEPLREAIRRTHGFQ
jgi:hypothetical protein